LTKESPEFTLSAAMELPSDPVQVVAAIAILAVVVLGLLKMTRPATPFLVENRRKRVKVPLIDVLEISHDTKRFRFGLPSRDTVLGLPVGNHFKLHAPNVTGIKAGEWNGREDPEAGAAEIERKYTPTTSDADRGFFDLVVKVYKGGVVDRFPDGGKMSCYLDSLKAGRDEVEMDGPWGSIEYKGAGKFQMGASKVLTKKKIGMIAGGTGITPMLQVAAAVLKEDCGITVSLLYANQTEADILVRQHLESLQEQHPGRFSVWYTLDRPPTPWAFSTGFIDKAMIADHLPGPGPDTLVLLCGPPPMIKFACEPNLEANGFTKDMWKAF